MGGSSSKDFQIKVKTGDVKGAGTDANIYCAFIDEAGNRTSDMKLDCIWKNDFEKGNEDTFSATSSVKIGKNLLSYKILHLANVMPFVNNLLLGTNLTKSIWRT